jgi:hypothetical protein
VHPGLSWMYLNVRWLTLSLLGALGAPFSHSLSTLLSSVFMSGMIILLTIDDEMHWGANAPLCFLCLSFAKVYAKNPLNCPLLDKFIYIIFTVQPIFLMTRSMDESSVRPRRIRTSFRLG